MKEYELNRAPNKIEAEYLEWKGIKLIRENIISNIDGGDLTPHQKEVLNLLRLRISILENSILDK